MGLGLIRVFLRTDKLAIDEIVSTLMASIEGARVTSEDWYADFRRAVERARENQQEAGSKVPRTNRLFDEVDSAEKSLGPRKELALPMIGGGCLKGYITRQVLSLTAEGELGQRETVTSMVSLLRSLGVVTKVEIFGPRPEKGSRPEKGQRKRR